MDDTHTQWLQMACAIWGEKYRMFQKELYKFESA
jgi:hypothetical protein